MFIFLLTVTVQICYSKGCDSDCKITEVISRAGNFSLRHPVQNGSGAHPSSYLMGTGGFISQDKAAGAWRWSLTSI